MATANPWSRFRALLPQQVRYRATIISVDSVRGTSMVRTGSGDQIAVLGATGQAGDQVMVIDGTITATLPALPYSRVEV